MFVIPDLSKCAFTRVSVSVEAPLEEVYPGIDATLTDALMENLARSIPAGRFELRRGCTSFAKPCVLSFAMTAGANIELGIEMDWLAAGKVEGTILEGGRRIQPIEKLDASDFALQVHEKLSVLYGCKLFGGSECHFALDVDDLPPGGIVRRGIGAQARFERDTLRLVGAQFAINDDNWHRLSWFTDPGAMAPEAWESIEGRVECVGVKEIGPTLLVDIVESAQRWVDRYILESSEVAAR